MGDSPSHSTARQRMCVAVALAVFMIFAAGLHRIIRRGEDQDGWLATASLASVVAGAGIFGAGTALFMIVAYRPATDPAVVPGVVGRRLAGVQLLRVRVRRMDRDRRHSRAQPPRAAPWTAWIGVPLALISLVGPLAVKAGTGAFSPPGWFALVVGLSFAVWVLAVSVAAWRSTPQRGPVASDWWGA